MPPDFPKLIPPQIAVAHVETCTGIALTLNGRRYLGTVDLYLSFPALVDAETYARQKVVEDPQVDCILFDHDGKPVAEIRPAWVSQ